MIRNARATSQTVSGLRTRYFPKSRIGHGLISIAPWVDIVLLLFAFLLLESKFVLQPGTVVHLPSAQFAGGSHPKLVAVLLSVRTPGSNGRQDIVFFDDDRFLMNEPEQMKRFQNAVRRLYARYPDSPLVLHGDVTVDYGALMRILEVVREAGVREVNIASRSASSAVPHPQTENP